MESCAVIPQIKGKDGNVKDSKLFNDLLSFTNNNREQTNRLYYITKNPKFQSDYSDVLKYDDLGEVTMNSLLKLDLSSMLEESNLKRKISENYGFFEKGIPIVLDDTTENYNSLVEKAISFNTSSEYKDNFSAIIKRTPERGIYVSLEKSTTENQVLAQKMAASYNLNKKIRDFLGKNGISVGALNSLDLALGRSGVTDFSKAFKEGEGIAELIRIANGSKGEEVLPEEFAHFIIESMENEPVVSRLLNLMSNRELAESVLGDSYGAYETLTDKALAHEAAARLLLDSIYELNSLQKGVWDNLLSRVKNKFNSKFSKMDAESLLRSVGEAKAAAQQLATNLPLQKISLQISDRQLSHIDERLDSIRKLLKRLQEQEIKRYHIYKTRTTKRGIKEDTSGFQASQRQFINLLESHLMSGKFMEGIVFYLKEANDTIKSIKNLYEKLQTPSLGFEEEARYLREIGNYIGTYSTTIQDIRSTLNEGMLDDQELGPEIKALVNSISETLSRAKTHLGELSFRHFNNFLQKYFPNEGIDITFKGKEQHIGREDLKNLLKHTDYDPSLVNIWINSAAETNDIIIKLADSIIKKYKDRARNETIALRKRIQVAAQKLRAAGISNEDFMFEKDSKGEYTHNYVSEIQWSKFKEAQRDMYKRVELKYGKEPLGDNLNKRNMEIAQWYKDNTDEQHLPNNKYRNPNFLSGAELAYYNEFMAIRKELLNLLPPNIYAEPGKMENPMRAIQVRRDFIDRLSHSPVENWWGEIKESLADTLIRREDDTEFGVRLAPQDFTGRELMSLPIFFTKKIDRASDLSHDTVSTLIMFADSVYNYSNLSEIVDSLEVGRDVMMSQWGKEFGRTASKELGGKPVVSMVKEFGNTVVEKLSKDNANFITAYNNLLDSQIYGRYLKDEGTIGNTKIDKQKAASFWNRIASLNQLALSALAAMAASAQDMTNVNQEAVAGEFFNAGELFKADGIYFKNLPGILKEIGTDIKSSKLSLFIEKFDILHDYENEVRELSFGKGWFKKMLSSNTLYFMLRMGSHWGETRTALAQALHMKLKDSRGNQINLWDAFEVKPIDSSHPEYGATLELKKGVLKEDGTELTEVDFEQFKNKCMALNQRLYGIYNQADINALQRTAIGKLAFLYRSWMIPAINRRFGGAQYNFMLNSDTEGYYRTLGKFLWSTLKDLKEFKFTIMVYWQEMSNVEKANVARALTELNTFAVLIAANSFLLSDWDDKKNPWIMRNLAYLSRRLQTEVGAMAPTPLIFDEAFKILKSPMAGIDPAEGLLNFVWDAVNPWHWGLETDFMGLGDEERLIKGGKYEGHSKLYKSFMNSPFLPMKRSIERAINPEESMPFFNN